MQGPQDQPVEHGQQERLDKAVARLSQLGVGAHNLELLVLMAYTIAERVLDDPIYQSVAIGWDDRPYREEKVLSMVEHAIAALGTGSSDAPT